MLFVLFSGNRKQHIMKTKLALPAFTLFSILFFQSCFGPKNILKLQPEEENVGKWLYGQQFVADTLNGIVYEVGYERCQNEQYWFNFTVTNRSNIPILIDPSEFRLQGYNGYRELIKEITALNPENEILSIEKSLTKAGTREANHVGLSLLAASKLNPT